MKKIIILSLFLSIQGYTQNLQAYRINKDSIEKNQYNFLLNYLETCLNNGNPYLIKYLNIKNQENEIEKRVIRYQKELKEATDERQKSFLFVEFIIDVNNISSDVLKITLNQLPMTQDIISFDQLGKKEREKNEALKLLFEKNKK